MSKKQCSVFACAHFVTHSSHLLLLSLLFQVTSTQTEQAQRLRNRRRQQMINPYSENVMASLRVNISMGLTRLWSEIKRTRVSKGSFVNLLSACVLDDVHLLWVS